jgi:hypothetical protein
MIKNKAAAQLQRDAARYASRKCALSKKKFKKEEKKGRSGIRGRAGGGAVYM